MFGAQRMRYLSPVANTGSSEIQGRIGKCNGAKIEEHISAISQFFTHRSAREGFATPIDVFRAHPDQKAEFLHNFAIDALEAGFGHMQIALAIWKYRYPAKLEKYIPVQEDQAAAAIVLSSTIKMDWFRVLQGSIPIVEDGVLLNGIFGRREVTKVDTELQIANEIADTLYLPVRDQNERLPQAPWILFGTKARTSGEFENARTVVVEHRNKFKDRLASGVVNGNYFVIDDKQNGGYTKFRLACIVFDMEKGALLVVSDKKPSQRFADWAAESQNNIISCDDAELEKMRTMVERQGGLLEQMQNPRNSPDYRPWGSLLEEVGDYRRATNIWRYALIRLQVENVKKYEEKWAKLKEVELALESIRKLGCDDSRQGRDISVLGGILKKEEFEALLKKMRGRGCPVKTDMLLFVPHDRCGFLSSCRDLDWAFAHLRTVIRADYPETDEQAIKRKGRDGNGFSHESRSMGFFRESIKVVKRHDGVARDKNVILGHLPPTLAQEYRMQYALKIWKRGILQDVLPSKVADYFNGLTGRVRTGSSIENQQAVGIMHDLFGSSSERMRAVLRRALEVGVMELDADGFPCMPAARKVYGKLGAYVGATETLRKYATATMTFIAEQVARDTYVRYLKWAAELPNGERAKIVMVFENFMTGQYSVVPQTPTSADDFGLTREDFVINKLYTKEERALYGLHKWEKWHIDP